MTQIADSAGRPALPAPRPARQAGGKVIKTLSNIRFIRSTGTPRPNEKAQDTLLPVRATRTQTGTRETPKQPSEAYVPPEPPKQKPEPKPRRGRRRRIDPDPATEELIRWFRDNREGLPTEPYRLTPWQNIVNPTRFYQALTRDIDAYPDGPRSHVIGEDLRSLRAFCGHCSRKATS